ncbi:MAG TPA: acyl-CoA dehydrogenase family protein [Candidatus Omnitrophota bacterium]|nr:acyl-CoA dehydrogenase family protein [Candidatus Omnitrophota bacterium]
MDYLLSEQQIMIRDLCREITEEKIKPIAAELDKTEEFPHEVVKVMAQSDLFGLFIEEKYGGMGGGILDLCIATEEFSRGCAGIALAYAGTALGVDPILIAGNEEQKAKYLPRVAKGTLCAFGITEPGAGSDAGGTQTTAKKVGDHYILNGTKIFITNGGEADIYTIVAMTDKSKGARGASMFIVEKGTPGFTFGKKEEKLGIRASATRELIFQDCKIPKENLLGREGSGFITAMRTFDMSRPGIGAQAVGIAQGSLDVALEYAKQRVQFGKPISSFQGVQFMLADMATQIEAARALVYAAARQIDAGVKDVTRSSSMAKLFASDMAMRVTVDAVQIFGGYGYIKEYPAEKYMRDAKITQIYEGTNQIQRNIIALDLIRERTKK